MYVKVKVIPGAKKESFEAKSKDTFAASVREPALQNLANRAVLLLVARYFKVTSGKVRLISGHRSRSKVFSVEASE
ncbi:DUF167 domain-containing protein [Candidatus Parcubacteria bacterium]|nr:DUF167 domain-containing protein [Candidatus Parcubacteria bacterium]